MPNNISTSDIVANVALAEFVNNNSMVMTANRGYEDMFTTGEYRKGDTINIRKQNHFVSNEGRIGVIENIDEETTPLTIAYQDNVTMEYSSRELTLALDTGLDRFSERYIRPAIQVLIKKQETRIAQGAINELNFLAGSSAASIDSFSAVDLAGAKMLEQSMPILDNAYMALSVRDASALKSSLQNAFNDTLNDDISFRSALGHLSYFDIFQNQSVAKHTTGTFLGTPLVNGSVTSGNAVILDGFTPTQNGVLKQGDVITFATVESVDPISRTPTGQLMQFVVLADVNSDGGGNATVTVSPSIISDPANARQNVSTAIPNNVAVVLEGGASTSYKVNPVYAPRGLDMAVVPMQTLDGMESFVVTDKDANVSIRVQRQGDILNDVNVLRLDILWGYRWHPEYALKLISKV